MRRLIVVLALAELCSYAPYAPAQNAVAPVQNRVLGPMGGAERVTLKGNVHPLAQKQFDQGAAPRVQVLIRYFIPDSTDFHL
jgi:hypothetical protein